MKKIDDNPLYTYTLHLHLTLQSLFAPGKNIPETYTRQLKISQRYGEFIALRKRLTIR